MLVNAVSFDMPPWFVTLLVAITAAVTSSAGSYLLWRVNRRSTLFEKLVDRRLEVLSSTAGELMSYSLLRRHRLEFSINVMKEQEKLNPANLKEKVAAEKRLQQLLPLQWERALRSDDELPKLLKQLMLAQFYFGPYTRRAVHMLQEYLAEDSDKIVADFAKHHPQLVTKDTKGRITVDFAMHAVLDFSQEKLDQLTSSLLSAMRHELAMRTDLWRGAAG